MSYTASITSQGQLTIPKEILRKLGISGQARATVNIVDGYIVVEPQPDFWSLGGSLKSKVSLSNKQLEEARESFSHNWSRPL